MVGCSSGLFSFLVYESLMEGTIRCNQQYLNLEIELPIARAHFVIYAA